MSVTPLTSFARPKMYSKWAARIRCLAGIDATDHDDDYCAWRERRVGSEVYSVRHSFGAASAPFCTRRLLLFNMLCTV